TKALPRRFQAGQLAAHAEEQQGTRPGGRQAGRPPPAVLVLEREGRLQGEDVLVIAAVVAAGIGRAASWRRSRPRTGRTARDVGTVHHQVVAQEERESARQTQPRRRTREPAVIVPPARSGHAGASVLELEEDRVV